MDDDSDDDSNAWLIGAGINLCGCIMINLGTNLWKLSHLQADAYIAEHPKALHPDHRKSRAYAIGMTLFAIGNICNFASMVRFFCLSHVLPPVPLCVLCRKTCCCLSCHAVHRVFHLSCMRLPLSPIISMVFLFFRRSPLNPCCQASVQFSLLAM